MKLITISGLDGSGKSTQLSALREKYEKNGKKTYYFHAIHFSLAQKLKKKSTSNLASERGVTSASALSIMLREILLPIDIVRFLVLKKKLSIQGYDIVLSDRYFYDTLVNISYLKQSTKLKKMLIPRPNHAFLMSISPQEIMQRSRQPDQGIDYLKSKFALYNKLAKRYELIRVIRANKPADIITSEVWKYCEH